MSGGKEDSASLLRAMKQVKKVFTRSGRQRNPNPRYGEQGGAGGGRGGGRGRGRGGGGDFDPPPSASGDVAPELFLEGPSRDEVEAEAESRDEADSRHELEELVPPKKLSTRGEAGVPDERMEPRTQEAKALIIPDGVE